MSYESYYFKDACELHQNSDIVLSRCSEILYHAYRRHSHTKKAFPEGFNMHYFYLSVSKVIACIAGRENSLRSISAIEHAPIRFHSDEDLFALKTSESGFLVKSGIYERFIEEVRNSSDDEGEIFDLDYALQILLQYLDKKTYLWILSESVELPLEVPLIMYQVDLGPDVWFC